MFIIMTGMLLVMKVSVLIIAHNEEEHIAQCLESVLKQTQKADEIILIAHNSTDRTREIAGKYPIKAISFNGASGIVEARIEGLKHVTGDIILCVDGDSYADKNWVEVMAKTLKGNVLVGSHVRFRGNSFSWFISYFQKYRCVSKNEKAAMWIWGPSFAFWRKDSQTLEKIWRNSVELTKRAHLSRNPEDYWLALFMCNEGNLEVTNRTAVTAHTKEDSFYRGLGRIVEDVVNGFRARKFFR